MVKKLQARNERRKGRGFGFVTVATPELSEKAISEMNGREIEGREIAVKVAIDSPGKEEEAPPKAESNVKEASNEQGAANDENKAPAEAAST